MMFCNIVAKTSSFSLQKEKNFFSKSYCFKNKENAKKDKLQY